MGLIDVGAGNPGAIGLAFFCNNTEAIRKAIATGKPVVWFQPGIYMIDDVIDLPASLKRLNVMRCDLGAGDNLRFMDFFGSVAVRPATTLVTAVTVQPRLARATRTILGRTGSVTTPKRCMEYLHYSG